MKNIILAVIAFVLLGAVIYFSFFMAKPEEQEENVVVEVLDAVAQKRVDEVSKQIDKNNDLKTYKNNLALYRELMEIDPTTIDWYIGYADTYMYLGEPYKYATAARNIVKVFPDKPEGHLMLIEYYARKGWERRVIRTYNEAPDNVKANKRFANVYEEFEWTYRLRSASSDKVYTYSGGFYLYERNGSYGYKNNSLYSGISAKYDIARPFIEDRAAVYSEGEWYFIDKEGYRVLASHTKFEDLYSFSDGYAVAKLDGVYGYIDDSFKQRNFEYEDATSFCNGIAAVKKDGKWALMNKYFVLLTDFVFDDVVRDDANVCSRQGVVWAYSDGAYRMYNSKGKPVNSDVYEDVRPFYSEYAVAKKDGLWGVVDAKGKVVLNFAYTNASSCAAGMVAVEKDGKWGCVDLKGNVVLDFMFDYAAVTSDKGAVLVQVGEKLKFVRFYKFD